MKWMRSQPPRILEAAPGKRINLEALFDGKSPFDTDERNPDLDAKDFRPCNKSVFERQSNVAG
jgi:hypothetical protein